MQMIYYTSASAIVYLWLLSPDCFGFVLPIYFEVCIPFYIFDN